jgi:hypothetical protein
MQLRQPDLDDFASAWHWLREHPAFFYAGELVDRKEPGFEENLDITVSTDSGGTGVWLEVGGWIDEDDDHGSEVHRFKGVPCHDPDLDAGGETFEDAVKELARRVLAKHGDYPEHRVCSHCLRNRPAGPTDPEAEWFCSESCAACGRVEFRTEPVPGRATRRLVGPDEQFECEHYPRGLRGDRTGVSDGT